MRLSLSKAERKLAICDIETVRLRKTSAKIGLSPILAEVLCCIKAFALPIACMSAKKSKEIICHTYLRTRIFIFPFLVSEI